MKKHFYILILALLAITVRPARADFLTEVGSFTKNAGTPPFSQTVTLTNVSLTPKVLILWTTGSTAAGFGADQVLAIGVGTRRSAATQQGTISVSNDDANAGAAAWQSMDSSGATRVIAHDGVADGTLDEVASIVSFATGNFVLSWVTGAGAGVIYGYLVMGGSDIVDANVTQHTMPTVTGNASFTGVGFQPDFQLYLQASRTSAGVGTAGNMGFGWARADSDGTSNIQQAAHAMSVRSSASSHIAKSWQKATNCLMGLTATGTADHEVQLVSFGSDGMTLNFSDAPGSAWILKVLSIKGPKFAIGNTPKKADGTGTQAIASGLSFQPSAYMMFAMKTAANTAIQANSNTAFGAGASTSQEVSFWANSQDAQDPYIADNWTSTTKVLGLAPNNPSAVDAAADHSSMDTGGFTVNWTTNDAVASDIGWVAIGAASAPPARNRAVIIE